MKMIRRSAVLLLALVLLAASARAAAAYKDVAQKHWAYANIERATDLGLIGGVGNGRFGLGQKVTRAEYATMLCRLMGWTMHTPAKGSFADNQDPKAWYYSAIETAYANGALRKLSANAGVNEPLTRVELAVMTVRALGYASLAGMVQDHCPFTDVTTSPGYIALAYHAGFMSGVKANVFAPNDVATREQAATVLLRVYDGMHASVTKKALAAVPAGVNAVTAETLEDRDGRIPMCPRAPLETVYDAALRAGRGGTVALHTAPYNATTGRTIKQTELDSFLASDDTRIYRSTRYESSYASRGTTIIWFESAEDITEKVTLCRLLGIKTVYLID